MLDLRKFSKHSQLSRGLRSQADQDMHNNFSANSAPHAKCELLGTADAAAKLIKCDPKTDLVVTGLPWTEVHAFNSLLKSRAEQLTCEKMIKSRKTVPSDPSSQGAELASSCHA